MVSAATEQAVSLLPLSGPVEIPFTRQALYRMLGGAGHPHLALRLGTLDSFFARIARAFPFELGLTGDFEQSFPRQTNRVVACRDYCDSFNFGIVWRI